MLPRLVVDLAKAICLITVFRAPLRQCVWLCLFAVTVFAQYTPYRFDHWTTDDGLPQNTVTSVVQTRDGYLWLTTFDGLAQFDGVRFTVFDKNNSRGINTNRFTNLYEAGDGSLLIATEDGGLTVYRNGAFTNYTTADGLPSNQVLEFFPDFAGEPVIATSKHANIYGVRSDREGKYWVASNRGLFKLDGDRIVAHYTTKDGLPSNDVKTLHQDRRGTLWFGTYGGLVQLKDGRFISYTAAEGLAGNRVRTIYEDAEGTLWIGTYDDGLSRLRDGKFFNYRTEQGLYNNGVFQILEDRHGYFWISCNKGIYRVSRRELNDVAEGRAARVNSVAFDKRDGMLNPNSCEGN
jgi:ligand-binding sensor domain-containing protein